MSNFDVDLVVNCYEKTYRKVLTSGFIAQIQHQNCFSFSRKIVLINNVNDRRDAHSKAARLKISGEIDEYHFVADRLSDALRITGLTIKDFGSTLHYSDCALVAVTMKGSSWVVYWDAEVRLDAPENWIEPSLKFLEQHSEVLVANPRSLKAQSSETRQLIEGFGLGYGFSDQLFLARRKDFLRRIYKYRCLASLRYPLSHIAPDFEQRVDSYMRRNRRLRATYLNTTYIHEGEEGASYPKNQMWQSLKRIAILVILRILRVFGTIDDCPCLNP